MNNNWVIRSKMVVDDIRTDDMLEIENHEDWLDYLNLHETCWILFACGKRAISYDFGWPGTKHE